MKNLYIIAILLMAMGSIQAQEMEEEVEETTTTEFSISGSVDAYFRNNFGSDFDAAPASSFANLPGFALGMANLVGSAEHGKVGMVADLVFGPRGADAVFGSGPSQNIVNQLYAYWNVSDATTITLGNFNTFLGYEVISPTGNFNYSTSYMFSYGPFSHSGLKVDFALSEGWSIMLGVFNPTDATDFNPTNEYAGGAQLGYDFGSGSAYLNTLVSDGFFQIDLTAGVDLSDAVYLGINATTNDDFSGAALYLQGALSDSFKLGVRGEYFNDKTDVTGFLGAEENVFNFTISGNYVVDNLTIIPELRFDSNSADSFPDGDDLGSSLASFVLAAVYAF